MNGLIKRQHCLSIIFLAAILCTAFPVSAEWVEERWTDSAGHNYKGSSSSSSSEGSGQGGALWRLFNPGSTEPAAPSIPKAFKKADKLWKSNKNRVSRWILSSDELVPQMKGVTLGETRQFNLGANYMGVGTQSSWGDQIVSLTTREQKFSSIKYDAKRLALANALAVHAATSSELGAEDQLFLLGQVSELLQGHDLRVNLAAINISAQTDGMTRKEAKLLAREMHQIDNAQQELTAINIDLDKMLDQARRIIVREKAMQNELSQIDSDQKKALIRKRYAPALQRGAELQAQYKIKFDRAQLLKGELKKSRAKVRIRMIGH